MRLVHVVEIAPTLLSLLFPILERSIKHPCRLQKFRKAPEHLGKLRSRNMEQRSASPYPIEPPVKPHVLKRHFVDRQTRAFARGGYHLDRGIKRHHIVAHPRKRQSI